MTEVIKGKYESRITVSQTLIILTVIFFFSCISRFSIAPMMPIIEKEFGIGHGAAGLLFFVTSLGYLTGAFSSEYVSFLTNYRISIIISSFTIGIFLLCTASGGPLWFLFVGMLFVGCASGVYLPSGITTINLLVPSSSLGRAYSVHELAPNLGLAITPVMIEILLQWMPWRGVLALLGIASLLAGGAFAWSRGGSRQKAETVSFHKTKDILALPIFWVLVLLFGIAIGANIGVYLILPIYLVSDLGFERAEANTLITCSRLVGILVLLLSGVFADKFGVQRAMFFFLLVGGVLTILIGVLKGMPLLVAIFLQPILAACFFPVGFAALSKIGSLGVSLAIPIAFLFGAGGLPAAIGAMADAGNFRTAIVLTGALIAVGSVLSWSGPMSEECSVASSRESPTKS